MLQKLNERIQGVVAWVIIILIALTFTLFGVDYYLQSHQASNNKVVVNDEPITNQAFEIDYRRTRSMRGPEQMTAESEKQLEKNVLKQVIANTVTVQAAQQFGFDINAEQANAAIFGIPQFQQDGHFSPERYQQALNSALFTSESFQKEVRQGMLLNQQRFAFIGTAFALNNEVNRFVRLYMQTRHYDYLVIPYSLFKKQVVINQDDIKNYYQKNQNKFKTPEQVSINYIILSMPAVKSQIHITDEDVKRYYDENQNNYTSPAQWQAAHILFAVPKNATAEQVKAIKAKAADAYADLQKDPALFTQMVKKLSDDKLSMANDGKLPWLVAGQTEYDQALVALKQPGQISEPVSSQHGFEIFKLLAYKPATVKPFSAVEKIIKNQLLNDMAQKKYAQDLEDVSDLAFQTPDSLKPIADALNLPINKSPVFSKLDTKGDAIINNKKVINAAFSHDVLVLGNNSEPVQINNETVVVLRVRQHLEEAEKPLASVCSEIVKMLTKQAAIQKAKAFGNAVLKADKTQQNKMLDRYKLTWKEVKKVSREADHIDAQINDLAFSMNKAETIKGQPLPDGNYTLVHLKAINDGKLSTLDKEHQEALSQQIEASYGVMTYDLYVNNLISKAKIEHH